MKKKSIGKVTHYFDKIGVAVLKLEKGIKSGESLLIGEGDDAFEQKVKSMQLNSDKIEKSRKGQEIGLKVDQAVRKNWNIYKC